jgi:hypothetical protein
MIKLLGKIAHAFNVAFGRVVNSLLAAGLAAFGAFAFYQAAIAYESGDLRGALFLALFGCTLVFLMMVNARAKETLTESLRGESELALAWRLLTVLSKRR